MRFRIRELWLVALSATAIWITVFVWQSSAQNLPNDSQPQQTSQEQEPSENPLKAFWRWTTHDPVAFYTSALALFTGVLGFSTIGLWIVTARGVRNASRDTEIIQRAYIAVELGGLVPHHDKGDRLMCAVKFRNVGHLPARNVRWYGNVWPRSADKRNEPFDPDKADSFAIGELFEGSIVLPPGTESTRQVATILRGPDQWLGKGAFVWGIVTYDDGFGKPRFTKFCHVYGIIPLGNGANEIPASGGRLYERGNDAD